MGISLEELWKDSTDEKIVQAVGKWTSLNENAQRILIAEVKRRGLKVAVPELAATPAHASSAAPNQFSGKVLLLMAGVLVIMVALAVLFQ